MEVKDFCIKKIEGLVADYNGAKFRLEIDEHGQMVTIECSPKYLMEDEDFLTLTDKIESEFIQSFPDYNLHFISPENIVPISKVDYEKEGWCFSITELKETLKGLDEIHHIYQKLPSSNELVNNMLNQSFSLLSKRKNDFMEISNHFNDINQNFSEIFDYNISQNNLISVSVENIEVQEDDLEFIDSKPDELIEIESNKYQKEELLFAA